MKNITLKSFIVLCILISSCSSDSYTFRAPVDPSAANLSKPANNSQCLELEKVKFEWNKSDNTDNYTITIIDLISVYKRLQAFEASIYDRELPKIDQEFLETQKEE